MIHPLRRNYSFTGHQVGNPSAPPPGDRLDSEVDRIDKAIAEIIAWASVSLASDGSLKTPPAPAPKSAPRPPKAGAFSIAGADPNALAEDWAEVSFEWAEHMPDPIPPNILATMGITGDHWSSRWWANRAAQLIAAGVEGGFAGAPVIPGTDPTGVVDSTAGLQAAFDTFNYVDIPPGNYRVDGTLTVSQGNAQIIGQSAILTSYHPTADLFRLSGQNQVVTNLQFQQAVSVPRTAGAMIHVMPTAVNVAINNPFIGGAFYGIWLDGCTIVDIWGGRLINTVAGGHAVHVTGGYGLSITGLVIDNTAIVANQPEAGIYIASCGDLTLADVLAIRAKYGLWAHPTGAEIADNICVTHSQFDSCGTHGIFINPAGATASVRRSDFVQCWCATAGNSGVRVETAIAGAYVRDLQFTNLKAVNNGTSGTGDGLQATTTEITGLNILGGAFAGNNNGTGINLAALSYWSLIGATAGLAEGLTGNQIGLAVFPGSHHFSITACNFAGNTTAVSMGPVIDGVDQTAINNVGWSPAPPVWSPVDASGAALDLREGLLPGEKAEGRALAAAAGNYIRVGNMIHAYGSVTYPVTANTAQAGIAGLPFPVPAGTKNAQGFISYCSAPTAQYLAPNAGGTTSNFFNSSGAPITNAAMSGATVYFEFVYPAI